MVGFGFTLLGIACGVASLAPAVMIRRAGVSLTLLLGAVLLVDGFVALATAGSVLLYQVGATLLGVGPCGLVPSVCDVSNTFQRQSTALGVYFAVGSLGSVGGPVFFYVVNRLSNGWRGYWLLCAAALAVSGLLAAAVTRGGVTRRTTETAAPLGTQHWTVNAALRTPQLWIIIAAHTGCLLVNTTMHGFSFQQLLEHGQSRASAMAPISLAAALSAGSAAAAGVIGERVDARRLTMLLLAH